MVAPKERKPKITDEQLSVFKREYESGFMTNPEIGRLLGKSEGWVRKWAKIQGWVKTQYDTNGKVKPYRANELAKLPTSQDIAEHRASVTADIVREHRGSLAQIRMLTDQLVQELAIMSNFPEDMKEIAYIVAHARFPDDEDKDKLDKRLKMYEKMFTLHSRAPVLNTLVNSLSKLIETERKAFGLDKDTGPGNGTGVQGLSGMRPEALLEHVLNNKEAIQINMQINNYGGDED